MFTIGYTIYNKAHLLDKIISSIGQWISPDDELIVLFDGCTDDSIAIFNQHADQLSCRKQVIVSNEALYEIKANNAILRAATNNTTLLFQDDIICLDSKIRDSILNIQNKYGDQLGVLSGRHGYELTGDSKCPYELKHRISNWEHLDYQYDNLPLKEGEHEERTLLSRGPLVLTKNLIHRVGYLNEAYFPLWGDDMEYCCRAKFEHGLTNVVFQCQIQSEPEWGSSREEGKLFPTADGQQLDIDALMKRNWQLFISTWGKTLKNHYNNIESTSTQKKN